MTFEVILPNGDRAQQDSEDGILYAARTLISEAASTYGSGRMLRRDVIITRAGMYDGKLTNAAREGR